MARKKERARREKLRAARFLLRGPASLRPSVGGQRALLECEDRGAISIGCADLKEMVRDGLVRAEHGRLCLSPEGRAFLRRADMPDHAFQAQHDEIAVKTVEVDGRLETVTANLSESPLAQLARRRMRNGEPFLTAEEFNAGERLRADYTRGQIMPRIGMNWQASVASGRRDGSAGGLAALTEAAIAARQRVDRALEAVGPELSGILVDVCCFLKGLERVEAERGWPVRSAKVVLKTALAALSRHYAPHDADAHRPTSRILHWGDESYRPSIEG
jgi:hypothetical protein